MPKFPSQVPSGLPSGPDRGLFSDTSDRNIGKDQSLTEIVKGGLSAMSADSIPAGSEKYCTDGNVSASQEVAANTAERHSHANKNILDGYDYENSALQDLVDKKHSHANKSVLDALAFTGDGSKILNDKFEFVAPPLDEIVEADSSSSLLATGQTIEAGTVAGDLLYPTETGWKRIRPGIDSPKGLHNGVPWQVALGGLVRFPLGALVNGAPYYMGDGFAMSGTPNKDSYIKIGRSIGSDALNDLFLMDIDAERLSVSFSGDVGYFATWASISRFHVASKSTSAVSSVLPNNDTATGISSVSAGYMFGATSQKFSFATETASVIPASWSIASAGMKRGAFASGTRAYLTGGATSNSTIIESMNLITEAVSTEPYTLTASSYENRVAQSPFRAIVNHSYNWVLLGSTTYVDFVSGTTSAWPSVGRRKPAGGQSGSNGYFFGGGTSTAISGYNFSDMSHRNLAATIVSTGSPSEAFSTLGLSIIPYSGGVNVFDHGLETVSVMGQISNFGGVGWYPQTIPDNGYGYGYMVGGTTSGLDVHSTMSATSINFSSWASFEMPSAMSLPRRSACVVSSWQTAFACGGTDASGNKRRDIDGFNFGTGARRNPTMGLNVEKSNLGWIQSWDYAYIGPGSVNPFVWASHYTEKISFSTESVSVFFNSLLNKYRNRYSSFSNLGYWYLIWGLWTGVGGQMVQRFSFATESVSAAPSMSSEKWDTSAVMGTSSGYVFWGQRFGVLNAIEALSENDTWSIIPATLTSSRYGSSATRSSTDAYVGGGADGLDTVLSSVDRLNFSTWTVSSATSMGVPRISAAGAFPFQSNMSSWATAYGMTSYVSTTPSIKMDTDTQSTGSYGLPTSVDFAGYNSASKGFWAGWASSNAIWALDFATLTSAQTTGGLLVSAVHYGGSNSATHWYVANAKTVYSVDFSNGSCSSLGAILSYDAIWTGAVSHPDFWLFGTKYTDSTRRHAEKVVYSTWASSIAWTSPSLSWLYSDSFAACNSSTKWYFWVSRLYSGLNYWTIHSINLSTLASSQIYNAEWGGTTFYAGFNSWTHGYISGTGDANYSRKINFANDSLAAYTAVPSTSSDWVQSGWLL